jgi:hypothetical protein
MSQRNDRTAALPVAVIGGGPVGLAALAHLLDRNVPAVLLEAAAQVGEHFRQYGPVRLFSPWKFNVDAAMRRRLLQAGWSAPPDEGLPLASEIATQLLVPFAELPQVAPHVKLAHRVLSIARLGMDKVKSEGRAAAPFELRVSTPAGEQLLLARAVIDASGTWGSPNPMGSNGLPVAGEAELRNHIVYGIPDVLGRDRRRYAGKRILVLGAGHSAANALLWLAELAATDPATSIVWAVRGRAMARAFGGGAADQLPARGELGSRLRQLVNAGSLRLEREFHVRALQQVDGKLRVLATSSDAAPRVVEGVDEIICATGQRPDLAMTRELRLKLDPWLESTAALGPLIDPNVHSCGSVPPHGHRELSHPEPGFYTVGVKSYGRAPTFLMLTGYEQVRSVVAALAGDLAAADEVALVLPETGVCSTSGSTTSGTADGTAVSESACCAAPVTTVSARIPVRGKEVAATPQCNVG